MCTRDRAGRVVACGAAPRWLLIAVLGCGRVAAADQNAGTSGDVIDASEADGSSPRRELVAWNRYEGPFLTWRLGAGLLYDYVAYSQDDDSKEQMSLEPTGKLRDFRFLLKGGFPPLPRLSYTLGYMYDAAAESWRFRQTGLMVDVPELGGNLFIGRTKEGFSTNKLMVGYDGWTIERSVASDAMLPILADGVKWNGSLANGKLLYNLGWFGDTRSQNESFNKNDKQFATRAVWLPSGGSDDVNLLHLALEYRYGEANDGALRYRSKPESFPAQSYAVDTGTFAAEHSNMVGIEAYHRRGAWLFGMEYYINDVSAPAFGDPVFHGGDVFATWLLTGETRAYNARGGFFRAISPARPVFDGGPGAWELVLRYSYADFNEELIRGGKFQRITPMVNWHLSDHVRLELGYGYGVLDRFGKEGATHFFQTRLQLVL